MPASSLIRGHGASDTYATRLKRHWLGLALVCVVLATRCATVLVPLVTRRLLVPMAAATIAAEMFFYVLYYGRLYLKLNAVPKTCQPDGYRAADAAFAWQQFIQVTTAVAGVVDASDYLRQWFLQAKLEDIRRGNVEEMLVYGFYYKRREDMVGDLSHIPALMVNQLEQVLGVKFQPGYTPGLKFMSHLWDDLKTHYHPLLFYLAVEVGHFVNMLVLALFGFKQSRTGQMAYYTLGVGSNSGHQTNSITHHGASRHGSIWTSPFATCQQDDSPVRQASSNSSGQPTPVLFLHGVGGLTFYLELVKHIMGLGHPMVVVECRHVSLQLCSNLVSVDDVTHDIMDILDKEGIPQVCVVAHSYGTIIASRFNKLHKSRVHSLCLIDPVCMAMFIPNLLHNFFYRSPAQFRWTQPVAFVRDLVLWFASRDIHIAATFARGFYWTDLNLWPADLPAASCVFLSGEDDLLSACAAQKMLTAAAPHAKVLMNPDQFHGGFLLCGDTKRSVVEELSVLLGQCSGAQHQSIGCSISASHADNVVLQGASTICPGELQHSSARQLEAECTALSATPHHIESIVPSVVSSNCSCSDRSSCSETVGISRSGSQSSGFGADLDADHDAAFVMQHMLDSSAGGAMAGVVQGSCDDAVAMLGGTYYRCGDEHRQEINLLQALKPVTAVGTG